MRSKAYTYINTTDRPQTLTVEALVDGTSKVFHFILHPKQVEADIQNKVLLTTGKARSTKIEIKSVVTTEEKVGAGGRLKTIQKSVGPKPSLSREEIIKKSIILDIETTGLRGGDLIHQVATYEPAAKRAHMWALKPELLVHDKAGGEEALSGRLHQRLLGKRYDVATPKEGKLAETLIEMIKSGEKIEHLGSSEIEAIAKEFGEKKITVHTMAERLIPEVKKASPRLVSGLEDFLIQTDRYQAILFADEEKLKAAKLGVDDAGELSAEVKRKRRIFERLTSGEATKTELLDFIREGTKKTSKEVANIFKGGLTLKHGMTVQELMTGDLANVLKGKVTWIANASFEAKQFGQQINQLADASLIALNENRTTQGSGLISRRDFFKGFQYGRYEKELEALNVIREGTGEKRLLTKNPFFGVLGGVSVTSGDPFYSTDLEFNRVKSRALKSNDYSEIYEAMLRHTKEGDVRDIIDLVRSQQSQLKTLGILDVEAPSSLSMEVQSRLYGFTEQMRLAEEADEIFALDKAKSALLEAESHMALGDVGVTESRVLSESMDQLEALRIVKQGGAPAEALIQQAGRGRGAYFRAITYAGLANYYNQAAILNNEVSVGLDELAFRQRIGKSMLDLVDRGHLPIREQQPGYRVVTQASQAGGLAIKTDLEVAPKSKLVNLKSIDAIFDHLDAQNTYKHMDKERILAETKAAYSKHMQGDEILDKPEFRKLALQESEAADKVIATFAKRVAGDQFTDEFLKNIQRFIGGQPLSKTRVSAPDVALGKPASGRISPTPRSRMATSAADSVRLNLERPPPPPASKGLRQLAKGHLGKYGLVTGALAVMSMKTSQEDDRGELLAPSYDEFLKAQAEFYGSEDAYVNQIKLKYGRLEGLPENGLSEILRKAFTDFGSPYQGPSYTQGVLEDYNLRRERHKYIQRQFGLRHFSEQGDIGLFFKRFLSTAFRKEHGLARNKTMIFGGAQPLDPERYGSGARGKNLMEYTFNKGFNVNVEDADTISIRRKGNINSPLSDFMGTGKQDSMSIRLAGIDAPETAHQDRRAQPFAEKAKQIATDLINRAKDIRVITRKDDTTYGRQVGVVYVDGRNLNLELLRRGAAAYLPYKSKGKPPIYNQRAFEDAQEYAQESKRGMWKEGYFQAYKEIVKATGETTTFNTLANISKVAKNANLMSIYSLMQQAHRAGGITDQIMADILQTSEKFKSMQSKNSTSVFRPDSKYSLPHDLDLQAYGYNTNSINSTLDEIKSDLAGMIKTRGSKNNEYKLNTRSLRENNYHLVKDTLAARKVHEEALVQQQKTNQLAQMQQYKRTVMMESLQLAANRNMFNSPIQHHRM
ncbi:hypothetical protein CMI37_26040 [Candidatus Pacearchaeota archaeon]|nr:hypothetical protein [Candidatus Pacearchaeota archaeon]|tara:strand:- start:62 stop:4075 length:4014 start_codon:yes stop_codon:yes gene_type:complete